MGQKENQVNLGLACPREGRISRKKVWPTMFKKPLNVKGGQVIINKSHC